jgi:NAD(P)-dependent dehydrogenase (short-subunit alcohol dehydrogenase family)
MNYGNLQMSATSQQALVTGANRGLGLEFVKQLSAIGWRVFACCRNPQQADKLNDLAHASNGKISVHALAVEDAAQIQQLAKQLHGQPIDLLINNAGLYAGGVGESFGHTSIPDWLHVFQVNTIAPLKMAEAFVEHVAQSQLKTIATVTSKMGSIADNTSGGVYIYRSTKAALNMVMKSLAQDVELSGIKVALLHPGWVKTDMGGSNALITPQQSVAGMLKVILNLSRQDSGRFVAYDGVEIEW